MLFIFHGIHRLILLFAVKRTRNVHIVNCYATLVFRDQKIADQHATRRMFRWYMTIFRQFIEWSVLNTGVVLRKRCNGKKEWTGLKLKITLAEDLFRLSELYESVQMQDNSESQLQETDDSEGETLDQVVPPKIRFDKTVCHVPIEKPTRSNCTAHMKRKATRFFCSVCKKYLCPGICWKWYHTKKNYLYDDKYVASKVMHRRAKD